jgi:nucleoside 2-deoxyribosyltransferase
MDTWSQETRIIHFEKRIYLAGSIYNNPPGCNWKSEFKNFLHDRFPPTIGITFSCIDPNPNMNNNEVANMSVVSVDKQMIDSSDILVAYIEKCTFGTTMEIFYAYQQQNKLVIVIDPLEQFKHDIWLNYHSHKIVSRVGEAVTTIYNTYNNLILN